jgi:hypothetical protein
VGRGRAVSPGHKAAAESVLCDAGCDPKQGYVGRMLKQQSKGPNVQRRQKASASSRSLPSHKSRDSGGTLEEPTVAREVRGAVRLHRNAPAVRSVGQDVHGEEAFCAIDVLRAARKPKRFCEHRLHLRLDGGSPHGGTRHPKEGEIRYTLICRPKGPDIQRRQKLPPAQYLTTRSKRVLNCA